MNNEIEIHEAAIDNSIVNIAYSDAQVDVTMQIKKSTLINFIQEEGLNEYCSDVILGEYNHLCAETYLTDNLFEVCKLFIIKMMGEVAA